VNLAVHPVIASLTPVFLLIALGYLAGRRQWIRESAVKDLSNLVFLLLIPALLFRTMSAVHLETLDLRPVAAYFPAALALLGASIAWRGFNRTSVVMALGGVFSNMVMIGITLVELAYGKAGLVTLLTLVSVHALILLTVGSVVLELAVAREARAGGQRAPHVLQTAWSAFKGALIHPIPLPILCGLLFAQTGWALPAVVDNRCSCSALPLVPWRWCWWASRWRVRRWVAICARPCGSRHPKTWPCHSWWVCRHGSQASPACRSP
jgi:malonate transporter and related proteins